MSGGATSKRVMARRQAISRAMNRDEWLFDDVHRWFVNRHSFTIFVGGEHEHAWTDADNVEPGVEFRMADRFTRNLDLLSSLDPGRPITVKMMSCGGYWEEGMQMFSAILACPNPVTVIGLKHSRSMSSLIPLAADRFLLQPPAQYMTHRGYAGGGGTALEMETWGLEAYKMDEMMLRIYTARLREQGAHRRASEQRIREMIRRGWEKRSDVFYPTAEAVRMGFADGLYTGSEPVATKVNAARRATMQAVLARPISVEVVVS